MTRSWLFDFKVVRHSESMIKSLRNISQLQVCHRKQAVLSKRLKQKTVFPPAWPCCAVARLTIRAENHASSGKGEEEFATGSHSIANRVFDTWEMSTLGLVVYRLGGKAWALCSTACGRSHPVHYPGCAWRPWWKKLGPQLSNAADSQCT